ncbi:MAG TPA: M24 family metallopeptidase [Anaerolineaceae bacterium]
MKRDLDMLMAQNGVEALLVLGNAQHNPAMVYLTGGGHILNATLVKKKGEEAVLYHGPMERDEAARTGLKTSSYSQYPLRRFQDLCDGDRVEAGALRLCEMLKDAGVSAGKVFVYGQVELGNHLSVLSRLGKFLPEASFESDLEGCVLEKAMATKDEQELDRIRRMGQVTTAVVGKTAEYLTSLNVKDGCLVKPDLEYLTIGEVKQRINLWLAESGAENPAGSIFAIGRDAGVPHSSGNNTDRLRLGETIVFDIYPCEPGGGYFYDFTRTWSLGYASEPAQALYEQVWKVYQAITADLETGMHFTRAQMRTCELFEGMGHATPRQNPATERGYVHSVGHGVGLHIHEKPASGANAAEDDFLQPGAVFTIEPGLYYPDQGMGVRIEDTYCVNREGKIEKIAEYPYDFVLPVRTG